MDKYNSRVYHQGSSCDLLIHYQRFATAPYQGISGSTASRAGESRSSCSDKIDLENHKTTDFDSKKSSISQKEKLYADILIGSKDSTELIRTFIKERVHLEKSDARYYDYDFQSCFQRLSSGFSLMYLDYNKPVIRTMKLTTHPTYFTILGVQTKDCNYTDLRGIILGSNVSTFALYEARYGGLSVLGLESYRCISLVTDNRTYSFGSLSASQIYDIYIVFSMIVASNHRLPTTVPMNKRQVTVYIAKQKLLLMAKEKHLYLKELILVLFM